MALREVCHILVKNAYKLALELEQAEMTQEGTSGRGDGCWALYKAIWVANIPPKVRIFA
jgi:hypothetical protein